MVRATSQISLLRLLSAVIFLLPELLGVRGAVAQGTADPASIQYENPRFGFTAEWSRPWSGPTEITDAELGLEGVVLEAGAFSVLIAGIPGASPADAIQLTIKRQRGEVPETRIVARDQQGEAETATLEYEPPDGARRAYLESHPLDSPRTLLLIGLDGPSEGFDQAFADALAAIDVNGAPLFTGVPASATSDVRQVDGSQGAIAGDEVATPIVSAGVESTPVTTAVTMPLPAGPLDLPAMILQPDDLATAGLSEGFGIFLGELDSLEDAATEAALARGDGSEERVTELSDTLKRAGFVQGYYQDYSAAAEEDPTRVGVTVRVGFDEYTDDIGASEGFAFFVDKSEFVDFEIEEIAGTRSFGDESSMQRFSGIDPATGDSYQGLSLEVRVGRLTPYVAVYDWLNQEPDMATIEALMEQLIERIASETRPAALGAGYHIARLSGDGVQPGYDGYSRLHGLTLPYFGEPAETLAARKAELPDATDIYYLSNSIDAGEEGFADDAFYLVTVYRFGSVSAATNWLASFLPGIPQESIVIDMPALGDQILTYRSELDRGDGDVVTGFVTYLRSGADVMVLDVSGVPGIDQSAYEKILVHNLNCLTMGLCLNPVPLPEGFNSGAAPSPGVEAGTPTVEDAPSTPGATPVPTAGGMGEYRGVNGNWSLTWREDDWILVGATSGDGDDLVLKQVAEPTSRLQLRTKAEYNALEGDAATCLDTLVETSRDRGAFDDFAPLTDDGRPQPFAAYYSCQTLEPGDTVLAALYTVRLDRFEEQLPAVEQLLTALQIEPVARMEPAGLELP